MMTMTTLTARTDDGGWVIGWRVVPLLSGRQVRFCFMYHTISADVKHAAIWLYDRDLLSLDDILTCCCIS